MAHEDTILQIMEILKIADKHSIGDIMASKGIWAPGTSANNNSYKGLFVLSEQKRLFRGDGFFRTMECKSSYGEHARILTAVLTEILKIQVINPVICREITIPEIGLRPDAICLITKDNHGLCFILEVCNNETKQYLQSKVNAWRGWEGATGYLSRLFGYNIPFFDFVISGDVVLDGTYQFQTYIEEVKKN